MFDLIKELWLGLAEGWRHWRLRRRIHKMSTAELANLIEEMKKEFDIRD